MNWLRNIICGKPEPNLFIELKKLALQYKGSDFETIYYKDIITQIEREVGKDISIEISPRDNIYTIYPIEVMLKFHNIYENYKMKYKVEVFDCDNFSIDYLAQLNRFTGMIRGMQGSFVVGMVTGVFSWTEGMHQANLLLTDFGVWLLEPQSLTLYDVGSNKIKLTYL